MLRRLSINDQYFAEHFATDAKSVKLDPRILALVRVAALIAVGGAVPSYEAEADAAVSAGASVAEIVDVLPAILSIVGLPSVVTSAPVLAKALGYDVNAASSNTSLSDPANPRAGRPRSPGAPRHSARKRRVSGR